jgi:hypothetical protein
MFQLFLLITSLKIDWENWWFIGTTKRDRRNQSVQKLLDEVC